MPLTSQPGGCPWLLLLAVHPTADVGDPLIDSPNRFSRRTSTPFELWFPTSDVVCLLILGDSSTFLGPFEMS